MPMPEVAHAPSPESLTAVVELLKRASVEHVLLPILIQLVVILLAARLFAWLFRRLNQPIVVGEILAGLLLGPSLVGWLFPQLHHAIFHPTIAGLTPEISDQLMRWVFVSLSQIGLIFLLFLMGLEFEFGHLREHGRAAGVISFSGVACPFLLGMGLALLLWGHPALGELPVRDGQPLKFEFALFMGTAMSITAIPILGRLMIEMNITRTKIGTITITAAACDDATGWVLLAAVAAAAQAKFQWTQTLGMLAGVVVFAIAMIYVVRPLMRRWIRHEMTKNQGQLSLNALAVLIAVLFGCSIATNVIGIFAIFGAFVFGAVLSEEHEFRRAVSSRLGDLVTVFFLPIFFTYTGLRTRVDTLDTWQAWAICGAVLATAIVGKLGGCGIAAWFSGFKPREAACIGTMMNTRALMELIVINVGFELGVLPVSVYCMLVIMAVATTIMTSPLLVWLHRGTELEPYMRSSQFMARR